MADHDPDDGVATPLTRAPVPATGRPAPGALDEALAALAGFAPEFGPGLSNHGPMAAEALVVLGRPTAVPGFVDRYRRDLEPGPAPGRAIAHDERAGALGHRARYADWVATFGAELDEHGAGRVVAAWVPRLAPGSAGAATHGLIRTAHATRALLGTAPGTAPSPARTRTRARRAAADSAPSPSDDDALRRGELAGALAYWAAVYEELPGRPHLTGGLAPDEARRALPGLPAGIPDEFLITDRVRHLRAIGPAFADGVDALRAPDDVAGATCELAVAGAAAYLEHAGEGHEIAFVHTVTAPMALALVLGHLEPADRAQVFAYVWQAVAGIHAAFVTRPAPLAHHDNHSAPFEPRMLEHSVLIDAAVESGDEHAVKLCEAALRAAGATAAPGPLAAAADVARRLR